MIMAFEIFMTCSFVALYAVQACYTHFLRRQCEKLRLQRDHWQYNYEQHAGSGYTSMEEFKKIQSQRQA